jgi:hypothetical protein
VLQQMSLTPLRVQLDAEAPCEGAREGLLALALPAMEAALRRAPDALANPEITNDSVIRVRPRPGSLSGTRAAVRDPLRMQQRSGWCSGMSADVISVMVQV